MVHRLPDTACAPGRTLMLMRSSSLSTRELVKAFSDDPAVTRVSPNYWRRVEAVSADDPGLASQWGLVRVGAGDVWARTTGSPDVVVASIDTGVDVTHPDLADNIWQNPGETPGNLIDDDGNGYLDDVYGIDAVNDDCVPMDDYGHGTHTSGIMAGIGGNGTGVAGLGWRTKVMSLKFIDHEGWGTDAAAVECIDYVIHEKLVDGVNVAAINASWGGEPATSPAQQHHERRRRRHRVLRLRRQRRRGQRRRAGVSVVV
jgi:subtilisin family serine protease